MKAFTLGKSWHYYLANFADKRVYDETDICTYTRAIMKGTFWFSLVCVFFLTIAGLVLGTFYNIYDMVFNGGPLQLQTVLVGMFVAFCTSVFGLHVLKEWYDNRPVKERPPREPTFVGLAYNKFKNKTCFRINFK